MIDRRRLASIADAWAPLFAVLAVVWPLAAYRYAAAYDLPFHEEIVAALRFKDDAARYPPDFFVRHPMMPNQLFYYLAYPLAFLVSVHAASTIVLGGAVAGIPLGAARLARHLGKTRWVAVTVAPVAIGFPFNCGFVGNVLGLALFLWFLPVLDRFCARPTGRGAVGAAASLLLLDLAHESSMTFGALAVLVFSIGRPLRVREAALRLVPPLVALVAIVAGHAIGKALVGPEILQYPPVLFKPAVQSTEELPRMILGMYPPDRMTVTTYALEATLALLAVDAWRARDRRGVRAHGLGAKIARFRFALLAAALFVFYYVMPWEVNGATWIDARYACPAVAVLAVAAAPRARRGPSLLTRAVSLGALGAMLELVLPGFATTTASLRELDALIPLIAPGSAVGNAEMYTPHPRSYVFSVGGAVTRVVAARGGRTPSSFLHDSPIPPLVIAPQYRWDDLEVAHQGMALRPGYDLRKLRYFIVWLRSDAVPDAGVTAALAPDARFVARSGGWVLYESTHPVDPIDSPEAPVPAGAETVVDRLLGKSRPLRR
jgi:hypothetical protein